MRKVFIATIFLVLAFSLICSAETKKPVTLRLVTPTPEGDYPQTYRDKELAKRFTERAKGEYVIEVYAGGALAKLPEYFDAVRVGAVDMAFSNWGMFAFLDGRLGLLELPFLFANNYAANEACKDLLPLYDRIFQERFNAKGLGMMNTGGLNLFFHKACEETGRLEGPPCWCSKPAYSHADQGPWWFARHYHVLRSLRGPPEEGHRCRNAECPWGGRVRSSRCVQALYCLLRNLSLWWLHGKLGCLEEDAEAYPEDPGGGDGKVCRRQKGRDGPKRSSPIGSKSSRRPGTLARR